MYYFILFFFGAIVGSFLNVLIYRLPRGINWTTKPSHCPNCEKKIRWFHNIPFFSFIFLRGKCAFCHKKISLQYPLVEILMGIYVLFFFPHSMEVTAIALFFFYLAIASIFIVHFFIDLQWRLLLDALNLYLGILFIAYALWFFPWQHSVFGSLIGFIIPWSVTWVFFKLRNQVGLGGGDIKLYAVLGLFLGPLGIIYNIFLSCFLGALLGGSFLILTKKDKNYPIPFGPFILIVAFAQIFFAEAFLKLISSVFLLNS
ncbi:MAG: prepilin peptidase [Bacteriovoracaceae bacterium]|nr:prepilin peptidase [Bacteriovoracaceae bacterium]